jgi:hypothetical protein
MLRKAYAWALLWWHGHSCVVLGLKSFDGPSGIRTLDQEIKSLLLYR